MVLSFHNYCWWDYCALFCWINLRVRDFRLSSLGWAVLTINSHIQLKIDPWLESQNEPQPFDFSYQRAFVKTYSKRGLTRQSNPFSSKIIHFSGKFVDAYWNSRLWITKKIKIKIMIDSIKVILVSHNLLSITWTSCYENYIPKFIVLVNIF